MGRIYLDHHATTPTDPRVVEAMLPWFTDRPGNPSSPHLFGWEAAEAVRRARQQVAATIGARAKEVHFTAGATESNNIALRGLLGPDRERRHLVTTNVEHPAVLDVAARLEREGATVTRVPVDGDGLVDPDDVAAALRPETGLVSVMWVNNEIGTVQPIEEIAALCRERGVLLHSDAAQAIGRVEIDLERVPVDLLSFSAHKFYGPKGIGALIVRRHHPRLRLEPLLEGGGQEEGLRPGTVAVPLVVGLGEAARLVREEGAGEQERIAALRDRLGERLMALGRVRLNGHPERRVAGNLSLSFEGVEAEAILLELRDVGLSVGSACKSNSHEPSAVLTALGLDAETSHCTLRFGVGRPNTLEEIETVASRVVAVVEAFRERSRAAEGPTGA